MNDSHKIGYFVNQYPAVSHSFIRREIHALEKLGWEVSRYAIRMHPAKLIDSKDKAEVHRTAFIVDVSITRLLSIFFEQIFLNTRRFFSALLFAFKFDRKYTKKILKTMVYMAEACVLVDWAKKDRIQHIHAHFGTNSATVVMFAKQLGLAGYSFTLHGSEEFDRPETIGFREKVKESSFVASVSSFTRSQLFRWIDFSDWEKIHVIHCGLDNDFLTDSVPELRDVPVFVSVGRLIEQKGQILVIKAMKQLVNEGFSPRLILVGDGPMREEIEKHIKRLDLSQHITLAGSLSGVQVREKLAQSRAFLLPSFMEGLPVVIMEAFALGRPVISTYLAGIPELVVNGENGWLIPPGSVDDLVNAMREALQASPESLANMGQQGRKRVMERHDVSKEAGKLSELFSAAMKMP